MKARFETLLRAARLREDAIKRELADIDRHLAQEEGRLRFFDTLEGERGRDLDERLKAPASIDTLRLYEHFFRGMKQGAERQRAIIDEVGERREETRARLTEAARGRRTLEILREREILEQRKALRKRETAMLDEAALNQWRSRQEGESA